MPSPSPRIVPSQVASNGFEFPVGERAGVLLKHIYMKISLNVSRPPLKATSQRPVLSSRMARFSAPIELAQAASMTQLVPPRSRRLAIRPAATFPRRPGNEFSCQPTYESAIRLTTSSVVVSSIPEAFKARRQIGWPSRAPKGMTSSRVPVTPRITLTRERSRSLAFSEPSAYPASSSACLATIRPSTWVVSVASRLLGAMPYSIGEKSTGLRNPPRRA